MYLLCSVISIALITPHSSTNKKLSIPNPSSNHPKNKAGQFLKTSPQDDNPRFPLEAPSQLHLIQLRIGG